MKWKTIAVCSILLATILVSYWMFTIPGASSDRGRRFTPVSLPIIGEHALDRGNQTGARTPQTGSQTPAVIASGLADQTHLKHRKKAFFDSGNVPYQSQPLIAFWVSVLASASQTERDQALQVFLAAASGDFISGEFSSTGLDGVLLKEAKAVNRIAHMNIMSAAQPMTGGGVIELVEGESAWEPFPTLKGQNEINTLVEILTNRIQSEGDSTGNYLKTISYFTCNFYHAKPLEWWVAEYKSSPLAAILRGEPVTVWGWENGQQTAAEPSP